MSDPATPSENDAQPRADAGKPDVRSDPQDPLKVLLAEMKAAANTLGPGDAEIQNSIERLITQADDAQRLQQPGFRTGVAYVLQDLEKAVGRTFVMPPDLATEMRQSALSSPGPKQSSDGNAAAGNAGDRRSWLGQGHSTGREGHRAAGQSSGHTANTGTARRPRTSRPPLQCTERGRTKNGPIR